MKYFSLFLLLFINFSAFAEYNQTPDSLLDLSYKQNKQYFLDNYAKDDTSKALVNYFFRHRKNAFYETVVPPVVAGISAILLSRYLNFQNRSNSGPDSGYGAFVIGAPLAFAIFGSGVFLLDGQIRWLRFSRHRLLNLLNDYNSGIPLSKSVKRKIKLELYNLQHPN